MLSTLSKRAVPTLAALAAVLAPLALVAWLALRRRHERLANDPCAEVCQGCDGCDAPGAGTLPGFSGLPRGSGNDDECSTNFPGDPQNDGRCFALVHHHCAAGLQGEDKIPKLIRGYKGSALQQAFDAARGWTHNSGSGTKVVYNHTPARWTSVCAARPLLAGKGACSHVTPYEWRMWTYGHNDASRKSECGPGLYMKYKFRGSKYAGKMSKASRG